MAKPRGYVGVKMAAEIKAPCEIDCPTDDFRTPDTKDLDRALVSAVTVLLAGGKLYVGCMAGKGRTGLFLAVLCKAFGVKSPVEHVRASYYKGAVETKPQYKFVMGYKVPWSVKWMVFLHKIGVFNAKNY